MATIVTEAVFWFCLFVLIGITIFKLYNAMQFLRYPDKSMIWIMNIIAGVAFIIAMLYNLSNYDVLINSVFVFGSAMYIFMWILTMIELILIIKKVAIDRNFDA